MKLIYANTKQKVEPAIVDDNFYPWLMQFNWNVTKKKGTNNFYYHTRIDGHWVKMHRMIAQVYDRRVLVDHENHITHDNRVSNLRVVPHRRLNDANRQKALGTSKYKGVYKRGNMWRAQIRSNGKTIYLGSFRLEIDAAKTYDKRAALIWGDFAHLNVYP
jgi:hypothetical protein